jgi:hypothetical protein
MFSAKVQTGAHSLSCAGQFTALGAWSNSIARKNQLPFSVQLQLALDGTDTLTGQLGDGGWTGELIARRAAFSGTNAAPQAGRYTLVIPGATAPISPPVGHGFGSVAVDNSGNAQFNGWLADGSKITQSTAVSKAGDWPLYVPLYGGSGSMFGWVTFTNAPDTDLEGVVHWIKPAQTRARFYPEGFTNAAAITGSRFGFTNGVPLLSLNPGQMVLLDGNLTTGFTNNISIQPNSKVLNLSSNKLNLVFTVSSGWFKGTVLGPGTGKTIPVSGAVLQKRNDGYGFFLGTNQSGSVMLRVQ